MPLLTRVLATRTRVDNKKKTTNDVQLLHVHVWKQLVVFDQGGLSILDPKNENPTLRLVLKRIASVRRDAPSVFR